VLEVDRDGLVTALNKVEAKAAGNVIQFLPVLEVPGVPSVGVPLVQAFQLQPRKGGMTGQRPQQRDQSRAQLTTHIRLQVHKHYFYFLNRDEAYRRPKNQQSGQGRVVIPVRLRNAKQGIPREEKPQRSQARGKALSLWDWPEPVA